MCRSWRVVEDEEVPQPLLGEVVAFQHRLALTVAEGSLALNEILLPVASTWKTIRQSPSGHRKPTMSVPFSGRLDCKAASTKFGIAGADDEDEGPGWRGVW